MGAESCSTTSSELISGESISDISSWSGDESDKSEDIMDEGDDEFREENSEPCPGTVC